MRELTKEELGILKRHAAWLRNEKGGERADFQGADLQGVNLQGVNLRRANLRRANLQGADFRGADLQCADFQGADFRGADFRGADLAFCCWPLWCGSITAKADDRLFAQLLFHLTRLDVSGASGGVRESMKHLRGMAASDLFCEYREDIKKLEDDARFNEES
jgi:hypothetical protein